VSVERRGSGWRVRYREGERNRSKTFDRKTEAQAFEDEVRRRRRLGTLAELDAGREPVADFAEEWWRVYAKPNLAVSTRRRYAEVWDAHLLPRVGDYELRQVTPALVEELRAELESAGVGAPTVRKALFLLQGIFARAVVRGLVPHNPVQPVRKPRQRSREVRPLAPSAVETLRSALRPVDAVLVSLLAYAGLRPFEALRLRWREVRPNTLLVFAEKKHGEARTVRKLAPLGADLAHWRLAGGGPPPAALVIPAPAGKRAWVDHDYRNWRKREFRPALAAAGLEPTIRPYDLRHSFVSLLFAEGRSIAYVAAQAGHSKEECVRTYMHIIQELEGTERVSACEAIRAAREAIENRAATGG
jgi:integrase